MKYWMKPGVTRPNMKTVLNETENAARNVKQTDMQQICNKLVA